MSTSTASTAALASRKRGALDVATFAGGAVYQQAIVFLSGLIVAHLLGSANYGSTGLSRNIVALILILSPLGLDLAVLRHFGEKAHERERTLAQLRLFRGLCAIVSSAVTLLVILVIAPPLGAKIYKTPHFTAVLSISFLSLPFLTDIALVAAALRSLHRPIFQAVINFFVQPTIRILLLTGLLTAGTGVLGVVSATAIAAMIACAGLSLLYGRALRSEGLRPSPISHDDFSAVRGVLTYSRWLSMTLLMYGLLRMSDLLILGAYAPARSVGAYAAMTTIAQVIPVFSQALSQTLGPKISFLHHSGKPEGMKELLSAYLRNATLLTSPFAAAVMVYGNWLDLVFGASFSFSASVFALLAVSYYVSGLFGPMGYSLSMTGAHRLELGVLSIGTGLSIVSSLILTPRLGGLGAATAVLIGFVAIDLSRTIVVARRLRFVPGRWRDFLPPIGCVAIFGAVQAVVSHVLPKSLATLFFSGIVGLLIILPFYAFVLFDADQRRWSLKLVGKLWPSRRLAA